MDQKSDDGYFVQADRYDSLIQIKKLKGSPIGTTIWVELSDENIESLGLKSKSEKWNPRLKLDWYCWDWPLVMITKCENEKIEELETKIKSPITTAEQEPAWSEITTPDFDSIYWSFDEIYPELSCNGIKICDPSGGSRITKEILSIQDSKIYLKPPRIAILDKKGRLPLELQRYALASCLSIQPALERDIYYSLIAYALVHGPMSTKESLDSPQHPLFHTTTSFSFEYNSRYRRNYWWYSDWGFCIGDTGLTSLLKQDYAINLGVYTTHRWPYSNRKNKFEFKAIPLLRQYNTMYLCDLIDVNLNTEPQYEPEFLTPLDLFEAFISEKEKYWGREPEEFIFKAKENFISNKTGHKERNTDFYYQKNYDPDPVSKEDLDQLALDQSLFPDREILGCILIKTSLKGSMYQETLLSKIWRELLGDILIPFDSLEREALVEKASQDPILKNHIGKWKAIQDVNAYILKHQYYQPRLPMIES